MTDADLDRLLETALRSPSPSRTIVAGPRAPAASTSGPDTYERLFAHATGRLGMPAFDDRSDRASIDTWYPSARRLAAWPHADGLVFISVERRDAADSVLIGFATDEEIGLRRRYRGHAPEAAPAATPPGSPTRAARLLGLDVRDLRRGPHGLNPLSERRRDRALRWLALLALIAFLAVFLGVLIVANRAAG